jgi:hypothetical protein
MKDIVAGGKATMIFERGTKYIGSVGTRERRTQFQEHHTVFLQGPWTVFNDYLSVETI